MDAHGILAAVELALYVLLLVPSIINVVNFIGQGQTGWLFVLLFVLVKITGAAILLHLKTTPDSPPSISIQVTVQILYNIALGPLLSGTLSFVNNSILRDTDDRSNNIQSSRKRNKSRFQGSPSRRLRLAHLLIIAGLVLGIMGGVDRAPKSSTGQIDPNDYNHGATYLKASAFLFLGGIIAVSLGLLSSWGEFRTFRKLERYSTVAAALSLPLIFVRLVYSFLSSFNLDTTTSEHHRTTFNMFTGSWVV